METYAKKPKYLIYLYFCLAIFVTNNTKMQAEAISNERSESLVATIVKEFNLLLENNSKLAAQGKYNEMAYVINVNVQPNLTALVTTDCLPWVNTEGVVLGSEFEDICPRFTDFNTKNISKVLHYIIYIDFPDVILGTEMIAAQEGEEFALDYYTKHQNDVNDHLYEGMKNTLLSRLPIQNLDFPSTQMDAPDKILSVFGRWYIGRNNEGRQAVSYGSNYIPSPLLTPSVMARLEAKVHENEALYFGNKWSLINVMETTIDYFNNFVPPSASCPALAEEVQYSSAYDFINNICTTYDPPAEYLDYVWSLAKYIDTRQLLHPTNEPLPVEEINFLTDIFGGFINPQNTLSWNEYLNSQVNSNINRNFLGYIVYSLGTDESFSKIWTTAKLKDLAVQYLTEIYDEGNSPYYFVNEHRRVVLLYLLNEAFHRMTPSECSSLLNSIQSKASPFDNKRACIGALWNLSNLFWNQGNTDVELINLINRIAVKANGITKENVKTFIDGEIPGGSNPAELKKLVYWKLNESAVSNIESIEPEDRIDYSYNFLNSDFAKLNLTIKQCTLVTCTDVWAGNSFHTTCSCNSNNFFDYNTQDHRYENLDPFTMLYVVSPTNVMYLNLCSEQNGFCLEGVSPVTALSLALSIEKEQDQQTSDDLVLAGTILATALTFGEAYPILATGNSLARMYAGFTVANEAVISNMNTTSINNALKTNYHVDQELANDITSILDKIKIVGLAADWTSLNPSDLIQVDDAVRLPIYSKIAQYETKAINEANTLTDINNLIEVVLDVEGVAKKKIAGLTDLQKIVIRDKLGIPNVPNQNLTDELVELIARSRGLNHDFGPDLNNLLQSEQLKLLNDISGNPTFIKELSEIPEGLKAWKILNGPQKRIHIQSLSKVSDLLTDGSFMSKLSADPAQAKLIFENICKNAVNPLPPATTPKLPSLAVHLENLRTVTNKFYNVEGFNKLLTDLQSTVFNKQDGISHAINDMKDIPDGKIDYIDALFDGEGELPCLNCRYDLKFIDGYTLKYKEYKSLSSLSGMSVNQMNDYFSQISSLSELKYTFNGIKLSITDARNGMKLFLQSKAEDIFDGIQQAKFVQLFGSDASSAQELIDKLNTQSGFDQILSFVEIKI